MKVKNLEDALARAPFVPFDVHIEGKLIRVELPCFNENDAQPRWFHADLRPWKRAELWSD